MFLRRFWNEFARRNADLKSSARRRRSKELKRKYTVQTITSIEYPTPSTTTELKTTGKSVLFLFLDYGQ